MANPEHVEILKQGVEVWNKWRKENLDVKPNLSNLTIFEEGGEICTIEIKSEEHREKLVLELLNASKGASLSNINLTATNLNRSILLRANLQEAEFFGANLQRAKLLNANLQGARLFGANLQGTNLERANLQEASLWNVNLPRANLRSANLQEVDLSHANLQKANFRNAKLQGAKLRSANLQGTKLSSAKLQRAELAMANLQGADLKSANIEKAKMPLVDLKGANLTRSILKSCNLGSIKFNRKTKCGNTNIDNCYIDPLFRRHVEDGNYLYEFRRKYRVIYWIWWVLCDCGRSITRWAAWSVLFAIGFAGAFFKFGPDSFKVEHLPWNFQTMVYYSAVTFTTLGFGDIKPLTNVAAWWVTAEVVVGYIMLGGLISILANKLARRS